MCLSGRSKGIDWRRALSQTGSQRKNVRIIENVYIIGMIKIMKSLLFFQLEAKIFFNDEEKKDYKESTE